MKTTVHPTLIVDSREQIPLVFRTFRSVVGSLTSGDYSFAGGESLFAVERKSVPDLVASVTGERERFERELHRLRGFRFARLLIVGSKAEVEAHRYRSNATPKSVLHSLAAFECRYSIPVVWSPTPEEAASLVEGWAYWTARELVKAAEAVTAGMTPEPLSQ